ncbi:MAG: hypothetical protein PHW31_00750 [Candidatus Pacebacteria bacterium]|nr:hypothetical protein [Candidatus Paceibacterota bacterium]
MPKKNITTEDLAMMVQKGFTGVDKHFNEVNKEFGKVYKKLDIIDNRLDHIDDKLDKIEKVILSDHHSRIERLEIELFNLKNSLVTE